jgi:hypothetical protein
VHNDFRVLMGVLNWCCLCCAGGQLRPTLYSALSSFAGPSYAGGVVGGINAGQVGAHSSLQITKPAKIVVLQAAAPRYLHTHWLANLAAQPLPVCLREFLITYSWQHCVPLVPASGSTASGKATGTRVTPLRACTDTACRTSLAWLMTYQGGCSHLMAY